MILTYLNTLKTQGNFTFEAISKLSGVPEATVKNIFSGKTEDPRFETVSSIVISMGGSLDAIFNQGKSKDAIKETSVVALKEIYEYQLSTMKETSEIHINNIRSHYEQHHADLKENFERRLADKRELIDAANAQIKDLKKGNLIRNIIIGSLGAIFIILFIMEILHPEHGWLRY